MSKKSLVQIKKNVLIFGSGSYIGEAVAKWLLKKENKYTVTVMPSIGVPVEITDFSSYQVIYYVAGIAHQKETKENVHLYYEVNRNLACSVAKKAKKDGVGQFILMSTLSVYGMSEGVIQKNMEEHPMTHYGKSKLQADRHIQKLADEQFHVAIIRPPMVYGAGCKGNYQRLRTLALKTPIFPAVKNRRSMIFIDNLCDYIEWVIREDITGIRMPQNQNYVCTSEMVRLIARQHGKKILFVKVPQFLIQAVPISMVKKVFGSLICDCSRDKENAVSDFAVTIRLSERGKRG